LRNRSKDEDTALFLIVIWNAAGQETRWRGRTGRQKSKASPNLRVGVPQFSRVGSVRGQYFEGWNRVLLITKVLPWFLGEWAKRAAGNCSHDYPWFKKESGADHFRLINAE